MARIRTIKPEFFDDEDIAAMSFPARLAFIGLWQQADREGRLKDRPVRLKARIFPFDDVDMNDLLDEIARHKFIRRYCVGDLALIQVRTLGRHQHIGAREPESVLPPFDEKQVPEPAHTQPQQVPEPAGREGNGKEGNGKGTDDSAVPLRSTTPAALTFTAVGRGPSSWALSEAQIAEWATAFPGVNVLVECRKAQAWVQAKPERRKTARGMPAFLVGWLNRATNSGHWQRPMAEPAMIDPKPDARGHLPPCRTHTECNRRLEQEIEARKAAAP